MTLLIADTNRYHPLTDAHAYGAWSPVVIIELAEGEGQDSSGAAQRALANAEPEIRSVGLYSYLVATENAAAQGTVFARAVGRLRPGDFIIWDLEVGTGDQAPRADAFLDAVHAVLHEAADDDFGYSGASFWKAHLGQVNNVHRFIAAYGQGDPGMGNVLWQFTDAQVVPGVSGPCDCSRYAGTIEQWLALIGTTPASWSSTSSSAAPTHLSEEDAMILTLKPGDVAPLPTAPTDTVTIGYDQAGIPAWSGTQVFVRVARKTPDGKGWLPIVPGKEGVPGDPFVFAIPNGSPVTFTAGGTLVSVRNEDGQAPIAVRVTPAA